MSILNMSGYQFIAMQDLPKWRDNWLHQCQEMKLKGTILLSREGFNINLAGPENGIRNFQAFIQRDFPEISFRESGSPDYPFRHLKIRIKKEIITFRQPETNPVYKQAPDISPGILKQWLDEKRDLILLDTRNHYEILFGSFINAIHLNLEDFQELPARLHAIPRDKPIVTFCTGGIRCEKAALYMLNKGYDKVCQLKGGILAYFHQIGGLHYQGECFVFDERISLNSDLKVSGSRQCSACQKPIPQKPQPFSADSTEVSCPACHSV